jgi:ribonucleotide reductase alpha subunit
MATLEYLSIGLKTIDPSVIELFSGKYDSEKTLSLARRHGTDVRNRDNYRMAGRLWMYDTIRSVSSDMHIYAKINKHRLSPVVRHFIVLHADIINNVLAKSESKNMTMFDLLQATTLTKSYLLRPMNDDDPSETPEQMFIRISVQLYYLQGIDRVIKCYYELSSRWYVPASPTIFNAGTKKPQMSSCFLSSIQDDLESILYTGVGDSGLISKHNGGLGLNVQLIRHSEIGESGMSSGILPFLRIYDKTIDCVDQGGMRKGAGTAFLRIFHIDLEDFVQSTDNFKDHTQRLFNFNTCLWTSRLFFTRVSRREKWTLFCPARATTLNELYGHDFEVAYLFMEIEAERKEMEYQNILIEIKGLESYLASVSLTGRASIEQVAFHARMIDEKDRLKNEMLTADDERKKEIQERLLGTKNIFLADPSNLALGEKLRNLQEKKRLANRARITHIVIPNAYELIKMIVVNQIGSSFPYIMHGDSVNAKSNQKNLGSINASNLCLEIVERSGISPIYGDEEIASCNLSSMNLPCFVTGKLDWTNPTTNFDEICRAYNFTNFSKAVRSVTENLDRVIELNYYPLDKRDEHGVIEKGKISRANFRHRPIGIGVSGLADTYYNMDIPYIGEKASLVNQMIFACMYFNSLAESLRLSIRDGAYESFRLGKYKEYIGLSEAREPIYVERTGSPLSNGKFQFDLWAEEAKYLADTDQLNTRIYDRELDKPLSPSTWGQLPIQIKETSPEGDEINLTILPTWDSLRELIMKYGTRHSQNIALMPTATSAQLVGNLESTEAPQTLFYSRKLLTGNFTVTVPQLLSDLTEIGINTPNTITFILGMNSTMKLLDKYVMDHLPELPDFNPEMIDRVRYLQKKYLTMFEISQKDVISQAAARGRYICQSQSLNIYIKNPTPDQLIALHSFTSFIGLKTGMYYLRQDSAVRVASFNGGTKMARYIESITEKGTAVKLLAEAAEAPPTEDEIVTGCVKGCSA